MKEALFYTKNNYKSVDCNLCNHRCHILPGMTGICAVRRNIDGTLYSLNYNKFIAINIDPIEKKPFFHFLPDTQTYSVSAMGCNFSCLNCQNWQISQLQKIEKLDEEFPGEEKSADDIVSGAIENNCPSISYTYTEPTVFVETALPIMQKAKESNLKNVWVSNGYMSKDCLDSIIPYLDAINIDIKFFDNKKYKKIAGASLEPILENLLYLKKHKIFIEITTLLIPDETNSKNQIKDIAKFIYEKLGKDTPWHISKFSPEISYKLLSHRASSEEELENAYNIGKSVGLNYVYLGNIASDSRENTYCSSCGVVNIERQGYIITRCDTNGLCQNCKKSLNIISK
ncbi:MAG: AmmeMemoRadiSam system radical SAM enzyme [Patescibacteria group bacterium]|nr:AmmeMemoRadiSam system radical SAM enzyme [Patescibacteria group bacterium]MDD4304815.1 AmmeMemoRadiSam system radical SAM enzyme [Patescibacteria group bacterium]MDD4695788.1 AmmeMemoRadiSam system radical SAM enzyme [Patescibacteria group bacterium]